MRRSNIPSTTHVDAQTELLEMYGTRRYAPYPQYHSSTRGLGRSSRITAVQRAASRTKRNAHQTSNSRLVGRSGDGQAAVTHGGGHCLEPQRCRGRTIYNATTTCLGEFGEIYNALLPNGEVDPTLLELVQIIREERLRVAEWQAFIYGKGSEFPDSLEWEIRPVSTTGFPSSRANVIRKGQIGVEDEDVSDAMLEILFYKYFNFKEYML